jgi:hypothetical protein
MRQLGWDGAVEEGSAGVPPVAVGVSPATFDARKLQQHLVCVPRWKPVVDDADWQRPRQTRSPSSTDSFRLGYLLLLVACLGACAACGSKVQVTVKVVDDSNQPVPNAKVVVMGLNTEKEGKTDKDGIFPARLRNVTGQLDFVVQKEGFYTISWFSYYFTGQTNRHWQPWNPIVQLQLRKRGKPVQMIVKQVDDRDIPAVNRAVGYDLLIGDWVEPGGKGKTEDFAIEVLKPLVVSRGEFMRLRLTFSNPGDGLVLKRLFWRDDYGLRLNAMAPDNGYSNHWEWQACSGSPVPNLGWNVLKNGDQDVNFYFRVRTQTNQQGQIVSAMYGKIYEGFQFGSATYPERMPLHFLYYLNSSGTRNTEWDVRSNLCPNPGDVGGRP